MTPRSAPAWTHAFARLCALAFQVPKLLEAPCSGRPLGGTFLFSSVATVWIQGWEGGSMGRRMSQKAASEEVVLRTLG